MIQRWKLQLSPASLRHQLPLFAQLEKCRLKMWRKHIHANDHPKSKDTNRNPSSLAVVCSMTQIVFAIATDNSVPFHNRSSLKLRFVCHHLLKSNLEIQIPTNCHSWTRRQVLRPYVALHVFAGKALDLICAALPYRDRQTNSAMKAGGCIVF